ncbi:hypothetical protein CC1G_14139 [Coprinopsis cinerea okayama7|uniref:Arginine N-methyltransferase 2 n=1 Tax=Coprinopsis cinerea (strain Okayama-7 / 130 / ATCC MYA-4618 / FGSC 9003) TaxID=240176 RepID=D6RLK0_COPC7|nr:hypothetical protein CC1G_14139 [Coprinopsis cinerea okayama7\|eukprot:XP_002911606.1 hypothetical protein CC1G_14139 [Coprinopsis cinerea okayama7\
MTTETQASPEIIEVDIDAEDSATIFGEHLVNSILEHEPLDTIKQILESGAPVWYSSQAEGTSALHAAAYTRNPELARILIEKGAIWNAVDHLGITAGEIALSQNDTETYTIIRDAGIRAELLLNLLSSKALKAGKTTDANQLEADNLLLREEDLTAAGSTETFLSSKLTYSVDKYGQKVCTVQAGDDEVGVMMGWEKGIMEETVKKLCDGHPNSKELRVLNVGFGLGIIDELFQSLPTRPEHHVIIEPHPDVLKHMKETGWYEKPGVKILEGKWQDYIESEELLAFGGFDVVYTDTFSEDYATLRLFFEHLPNILAGPESRFSFFHGLGATNALFYDVYTHISEMHLLEVGLKVEWSDVDVVGDEEEDRWGESREYFKVPLYRLPVASMAPVS